MAGITYLGQRDYSMRIWLDPDKLAALNLTTGDVLNAINSQNIQVAAGMIGQQPVPRDKPSSSPSIRSAGSSRSSSSPTLF